MTENIELLPLIELHIQNQAPIYAEDDSDAPSTITLSLVNQSFPSSSTIKFSSGDEITLLQLYLYLKYFGKGNVEYIKHSSSNRLALNVRRIVDKTFELSGKFKPDVVIRKISDDEKIQWEQKYQQIISSIDATQDVSKKRLASTLESQADFGKVDKKELAQHPRKRLKYLSQVETELEDENDPEILKQKEAFAKFVDEYTSSDPMIDSEESLISKYKDVIDLSRRNMKVISSNFKIQPYRDDFVGTYSLLNTKSYYRIEWKKILDACKLVQNDLRYREKYGDDSIIKPQQSEIQKAPPKTSTDDAVGDEFGGFGINPMGSNLDGDVETQFKKEEEKRREAESRARQQMLSKQQAEAQRTPPKIIIVPAAVSSILTLANAKSFLEDGKFITSEEAKATEKKKSGHVYIRVKNGDLPTEVYMITDRPQSLQPNDWKRVAAIFTNGKEWEFKNCRYTNATELFSRYPGFSLIYDDQQVNPNLKKWPVRILKISRMKRHLDNPIVKEFWKRVNRA